MVQPCRQAFFFLHACRQIHHTEKYAIKKLGRVGKDRPTGIDFLEEASASPIGKIPEPWPRPDTEGCSPWEPCLGHVRVLRPTWAVHTSALAVASEGIFLTSV